MKNEIKGPILLGLALYGSFASNVSFAANDHIKNALGQCLEAQPAGNTYVRDCVDDEPKQSWTYNAQKQLVNANGLCLTLYTPNGGAAVMATCKASNSRKWDYDAVTQQYKNLYHPNQCLDVNNWGYDELVIGWDCHDGANQQWAFFSEAPPKNTWLQHDLKLNGIGVGVVGINKVLMASLGDGFDTPANYAATINYGAVPAGYTFTINGTPVSNSSSYTFTGIKYGSSVPIQRKLNGVLVDTYDLVFTNLPVIQIKAMLIQNEPKLEGTFRLMSRLFNQDTGVQKMGIEWRGNTALDLPKKAYGLQIGTATDWTKGLDVKLLDMRNDSDWILDAAYRDQSFARNIVSHDIFRTLHPTPYTGATTGQSSIKGQLTEVIKNEVYQGIYVLEEKPDRKLYGLKKIVGPLDAAGNVIWSQVDFTNPENGSVLYKAFEGSQAFYGDIEKIPTRFEQIYPKATDVTRLQPLVDLVSFVANSTDAAFIADIGNKVDIDSVVDWWSLVLLSNASDNMKKNFNIGKSGANKFFIATWDHDATFGMDWQGGLDNGIYTLAPVQDSIAQNNLIRRLTTLPATGFNAKLKARWTALRATTYSQAALTARFDSYITQAAKGGATARNKISWPGTGNTGVGTPALGTTAFIDTALAARLPLLDQYVNTLPVN